MKLRPTFVALVIVMSGSLIARVAMAVDLVVVQGAAGEPHYDEHFSEWANAWADVAGRLNANLHRVHEGNQTRPARAELEDVLNGLETEGDAPLWLVLIGHGTFAQDLAKFNLVGADISARELADLLTRVKRPTVVVNCASASGPFIDRLSGNNRIVITATKSGQEQNYARFGGKLVSSANAATSDLDHDGTISLLEAFLAASKETANHYRDAGLLATEHPMIDDNGDRTGTTADFFRGIRVTGRSIANQAVDGHLAHRLTIHRITDEPNLAPTAKRRRDQLEQEIEQLRLQKSNINEDDYYEQLEPLLVEIAMLYEKSAQGAKLDSQSGPEPGGE